MKRYIYLALIFASCQSDPVSEPAQSIIDEKICVYDGINEPIITGNRSGLAPLFYKESLTTDNYVMSGQPHTQRAYNKAKVDSVFMTRVGTEIVNVNYVDHAFYDVRIKFIGDTIGSPVRYLSVVGANVINYNPYGTNVLHSTNNSRVTSLVQTNERMRFPGWEIGRLKYKYKYIVLVDSDTLGSDFITPLHPVGSKFGMPHK